MQDEHRDEKDQASPIGVPEQTGKIEPVFGGSPGERPCMEQTTVRCKTENEFANDAENNGDLGGATDGRAEVFHARGAFGVGGQRSAGASGRECVPPAEPRGARRGAQADAFAPIIAAFAFLFIRFRAGGARGRGSRVWGSSPPIDAGSGKIVHGF